MSWILELIKELLIAWRDGQKKTRIAIIVSGFLVAFGAAISFFSNVVIWQSGFARTLESIGVAIMAIGGVIAILISVVQKSKEEFRREQKIEAVEKRVQENPGETQIAWELARVKLESYLNRNLSQVRSIFWLTVTVMMVGFILISVGVYEAFVDMANFNASILAAVSGVIVSFIGGTFLVLYKATMEQAKDYVTILERINAVGMSVQILDTINDNSVNLKEQTTADVAKQLLSMYSDAVPNKSVQRSRRRRVSDGSC